MSFWDTLKGWAGDVTKGVEEVVPGARQIDQFLNKAGIGPQDFLQNPFKPQGWAGDIEHGLSQASHSPVGRSLEEMAAIAAMAYFAPELIGTMTGDFSAADMEAIAQGAAEYTGETAAATTAAPLTSAAAEATATGAAAAPAAAGAMPELTVSGTALAPAAAGSPEAAAAAAAATAAAQPAGQEGRAPTQKDMMPEVQVNAQAPTVDVSGTPFETTVAPPLFAGTGDPYSYTFGATPSDTIAPPDTGGGGGPGPYTLPPDLANFDPGYIPSAQTSFDVGAYSMGGGNAFASPDAGSYLFNQPYAAADAGGGGSSWLSQLGKTLATPKGALTGASLAAGLYSLLNRTQLPGAANTALNAAGPAVANATSVIQTGGMGTPLWNTQKAAIDAQIDQQIQNLTRSMQQTMQNTSGQGSNSAAVQAQIAQITSQLETQREALYQQVLQQNVTNAMNELSGGNATLTAIANLQMQEDQYAQQLARNVGLVTGNLASLWPSG